MELLDLTPRADAPHPLHKRFLIPRADAPETVQKRKIIAYNLPKPELGKEGIYLY
jgi:hypothetical protein